MKNSRFRSDAWCDGFAAFMNKITNRKKKSHTCAYARYTAQETDWHDGYCYAEKFYNITTGYTS